MTLSQAKAAYAKAKTSKGKTSAFNKAMLNLSYNKKQEFYKWQVEFMNNQK